MRIVDSSAMVGQQRPCCLDKHPIFTQLPNLVLGRLIDDDILDSTRSPKMPSVEESKCILVTGATAEIGRVLALALARLSSKPQVIAMGRRQDRLNELKTAGLEVFQLET